MTASVNLGLADRLLQLDFMAHHANAEDVRGNFTETDGDLRNSDER